MMSVRNTFSAVGIIVMAGLFACDSGKAPSAAKPAAPKPSAASEPVKPADPAPSAAEATPAAKAMDKPAMKIPVAADFEAEADAQITEKNYKAELENIEKAIANPVE